MQHFVEYTCLRLVNRIQDKVTAEKGSKSLDKDANFKHRARHIKTKVTKTM